MFFYAKEVIILAFTIEKVAELAHLSSLDLSEEEKGIFTEQLNSFLQCAEQLKKINTDDVEPLIHILPIKNVFRPDEVKPSSGQEVILRNAKVTAEGHYKVPRIM